MSKVKRYDPGCEYAGQDEMIEAADGDFVRWVEFDAMQQKLDEANKELARYSMSAGQADQFAAEAKAVRKALSFAENAEDVAPVDLLEKIAGLRAEGIEMFADWLRDQAITFDAHGRHGWADKNRVAADTAKRMAAQIRAETDTTPSQYESLAGGK